MDDYSKKIWRKRIRHTTIVTLLLLFICFIGIAVFKASSQMSVFTMSKQTAHSADSNHSAPASSNPVSSKTVPQEATSSELQPISSEPEPSQVETQQTNISSHAFAPAPQNVPPKDSSAYQALYPKLNIGKVTFAPIDSEKVVYLTFDDGPSNLTIPLLNVLDHYQVKVTFFLIGKTDAQDIKAMKAIADRGHAIGVHSYTHQYLQIYASPEAFLNDFAKMHDLIQNVTGVEPNIYRYAGGSVNSFNQKTAKTIIAEMNRRGYVYYDWNVSSGDAEYGATAQSIYNNTVKGVHSHVQSVVLFHNTASKGYTLSEIPKIIETLKKEGYHFETLNQAVDNRSYIFPIPKS